MHIANIQTQKQISFFLSFESPSTMFALFSGNEQKSIVLLKIKNFVENRFPKYYLFR